MRIVIVGKYGPPVLACIRSWGRNGYDVGFVCISQSDEPAPSSKYLKKFIRLMPEDVGQQNGLAVISRFINEFEAVVLSCIDEGIACWLNDNKSSFNENLRIALPDTDVIKNVLSKTVQNDTAEKCGLTVLDEYRLNHDCIDKISIPEEHFPLCLRPSDPHGIKPLFKVEIVKDIHQLKQFVHSVKTFGESVILAQPFKELPNLVIHGTRTVNGDNLKMSAFIVERKFEGVTLTIRPFNDIDESFLQQCAEFADELNITGNYHFEFLYDKHIKQSYFLELNLRFGGTTAKVLQCGYEEPMYALESFGLVDTAADMQIKDVSVSNKLALIKYALRALKGNLSPLDFPQASLSRHIIDIAKAFLFFKDEIIDMDDLKGCSGLYWNTLSSIFIKTKS